ncbi:MAG: 2-C-methyl-D-erythritol 4-phosphate cytidylyltransferase [Gammaproteobacteria bacterium]
MNHSKSFWIILPAAGVGQRMAADRPKQYLPLQDKTVIEYSLQKLLDMPSISGVVLALDKNDSYWPELQFSHSKPVLEVAGGDERCDSVLNALHALEQYLPDQSQEVWVLVHDAARPCVRADDITKLINKASHDDHGGLLALPVRDTMKRQLANNRVQTTVDRTGLWHALTPQMFKLDLLIRALQHAAEKGLQVTDDASAMELVGYHPLLVEGHEDNIKITRPFDLVLAGLYLQEQMND